jgi:hypothetical protein
MFLIENSVGIPLGHKLRLLTPFLSLIKCNGGVSHTKTLNAMYPYIYLVRGM